MEFESTRFSEAYIRQQCCFYGKDPSKKITEYHRRVNAAAFELATQQPHLLCSRHALLQRAQERVEENGYIFKKGRSRAKRHSSNGEDTHKTKRSLTTEAARLHRIAVVDEELKSLNERLMYKEKERDMASNIRNYRRCEELTREKSELKERRREYQKEKKLLHRKQMQSAWYRRKSSALKSALSSHTTTSVPLSPVSQCDSTVSLGSSSEQEDTDSSVRDQRSPATVSPQLFSPPKLCTSHRLSLSPLPAVSPQVSGSHPFAKASPALTGTGDAC